MKCQEGKALAQACYYDWDAISSCRRFQASQEWQATSRIIKKLKISGKACDLGAGNGIASHALAEIGFLVDAIEPDPSKVVGYGAVRSMVAKTSLPIVHHQCFGESLIFENCSFDLVYARQVLHHAMDLQQMLKEIYRVLKPGGVLIAAREHVIDDEKSLKEFLCNHPLHPLTNEEFAYTSEEYLRLIRRVGFDVEQCLASWESVLNHYPGSNEE